MTCTRQQVHRRRGRRVRWAAALGAVMTPVAFTTTGFGSGSASAAGLGASFSALAAADGLRVTVIVPNSGLADEVVDGGGPSTEARIDSLGTSKAFASFPYPGDTLANVPGLVRTLSGGVPVPDLPFFVRSDHPIVPKQEAGTGPYLLRAESGDQRSAAIASVGLASEGIGSLGLARSQATVSSTADAVISEATSTIESFFVGPLRLGHIVSHARVSLAPDGTRAQSAESEVIGAMVGSTAVTFTPGGLQIGAADAALPDTAPVAEQLAAAGITIEIMPRKDMPTGVVAPAIRVTQTQPSGSRVLYTLGGASASGTGEATDDSSAETAVEPGPASTPPSDAGSSAAGAGPAGADVTLPAGTGASATSGESAVAPADSGDVGAAGATGRAAVRYPTSFVVPDAAGTSPGGNPAGPMQTAAPTAPAPLSDLPAPSARRAAAVTALLGTAVDAKPLYGTLIAGGALALGGAVVIRGLRPGGTG